MDRRSFLRSLVAAPLAAVAVNATSAAGEPTFDELFVANADFRRDVMRILDAHALMPRRINRPYDV